MPPPANRGTPVRQTPQKQIDWLARGRVTEVEKTAKGAIPKSLATAAGQFLRSTASGVWAAIDAATMRTALNLDTFYLQVANNLNDLANVALARANLGLIIGTHVQAYSANLDAWAAKTVPAGPVADTTSVQAFTNKTLNAPTIDGGTIDNAPIGQSSPKAGNFTTIKVGYTAAVFAAWGEQGVFGHNANSKAFWTIANQDPGAGAYCGIAFSTWGNSWLAAAGSNAANGNALDFFGDATSPVLKVRFYQNGGIGNYSANNVNLSSEKVKDVFGVFDAEADRDAFMAVEYRNWRHNLPLYTFDEDGNRIELPQDMDLSLGPIAEHLRASHPDNERYVDPDGFDLGGEKLPGIYDSDLHFRTAAHVQNLYRIVDRVLADNAELRAEVARLKGAPA